MSSSTIGPLSVTIWTASAGRSTLFRRPRLRIAEATPAPVWPAVTTASALPSFTRRMQTLMLASRLRRTAAAGCSSMPTDFARLDDCHVGRQWTFEQRLDARLVADEQHVSFRVEARPIDAAGNDLLWRVIAAHCVDRDANATGRRLFVGAQQINVQRRTSYTSGAARTDRSGSGALGLACLESHCLAAVVPAAMRAGVV